AASAAAIDVLAVCGRAAFERGRSDTADTTEDAAAGLASRSRESEDDDTGYRHDGAYAVRPSNGWTQGLQLEKQREEKLSTDSDVYGRDPRICGRRVAQWRPAHGQPDCASFGGCFQCSPGRGRDHLCARRFRILLC